MLVILPIAAGVHIPVLRDSIVLHFPQRNHRVSKQEMQPSIQQLASRAASLAMAEAAKNMTPPTTAYQFEVSWKGFSGDRTLQAHLLKVFNFVVHL